MAFGAGQQQLKQPMAQALLTLSGKQGPRQTFLPAFKGSNSQSNEAFKGKSGKTVLSIPELPALALVS